MHLIRVLNFRFLIISALVAGVSWICSSATKIIQSSTYAHNATFNIDVYDPFIFPILILEVLVRHTITLVYSPADLEIYENSFYCLLGNGLGDIGWICMKSRHLSSKSWQVSLNVCLVSAQSWYHCRSLLCSRADLLSVPPVRLTLYTPWVFLHDGRLPVDIIILFDMGSLPVEGLEYPQAFSRSWTCSFTRSIFTKGPYIREILV